VAGDLPNHRLNLQAVRIEFDCSLVGAIKDGAAGTIRPSGEPNEWHGPVLYKNWTMLAFEPDSWLTRDSLPRCERVWIHFHFLSSRLIAGWINQRQQHLIEYLVEENRVLQEQICNRRRRFTDDSVVD
jgi:hypothetical protein